MIQAKGFALKFREKTFFPPRRCCARLTESDFVSRQRRQQNRFRTTRTVCGLRPDGEKQFFRYSNAILFFR